MLLKICTNQVLTRLLNCLTDEGANESGHNGACQGAKTRPTADQVSLEKGGQSSPKIFNIVHDNNSPQKRLAGLKTARALHLLLKTGGGTLQVPLRRNTRLQGEKNVAKK